jgi:hypothetical protein
LLDSTMKVRRVPGELLQRALLRADRLLLAMPVVESLLARCESGRLDAGGAAVAAAAAHELCAQREPDGSWQGSMCRTAEHLLLLHELAGALPDVRELAAPSVAWLHGRELPPPRVDMSALVLLGGAAFGGDADARIAAESLAVAALLAWGVDAETLRTRIAELARCARPGRHEHDGPVPASRLACIILALRGAIAAAARRPAGLPAGAAGDAALHEAVRGAVLLLARAQRADGSWADGDLFLVLRALAGVAGDPALAPAAVGPLTRAAELLAMAQQRDGGWGRAACAESLLIGWRVLRAVAPGGGARAAACNVEPA